MLYDDTVTWHGESEPRKKLISLAVRFLTKG